MIVRNCLVSVALPLVVVLGCSGCGQSGSSTYKDPTADLPARFKNQEPVAKLDFTEAANSPNFQKAIREAAALLGSQPQPLQTEAEDELVKGGVWFDVPGKKLEKILFQAHTNFLAKGFYLFRCRQNFDMEPDKVGLLPTADKYAVIAAMETNGDNYDIGTAGIIAWLKELDPEQPFVLTGIGWDYLEGNFTSDIKDPSALAKRMYQFCPDIVDQGTDTVDGLAKELSKGHLYFWWD